MTDRYDHINTLAASYDRLQMQIRECIARGDTCGAAMLKVEADKAFIAWQAALTAVARAA